MPEDQTFELTINGAARRVTADPGIPLLYVLRDLLGEREARFGCGDGLCGACTVIVDGRAVNSCDMPLASVDGAIETSRSLAGDPDHPILTELMARNAGQCGYCLSGIAMRAKAFLATSPGATRAEIAVALDQNLCRCGAHNRILDALEAAAQTLRGAQ